MSPRWTFTWVATFLLVVGAVLVGAPEARALAIIVPGDKTNVDGSGGNAMPFSTVTSMRYQQVYGASEFLPFGNSLAFTEIRFRLGSSVELAFSGSIDDIQLNLSTTSANPDGLSTTFANNVGADDTVVFARGSLPLSSAGVGSDPQPFDIVISLTTPFTYDPTLGNLLLDIRKFSADEVPPTFDAHDDGFAGGDAISRVFAFDVNAATGQTDNFNSIGLVTLFDDGATVPEPGVSSLLVAAVFGLAARCRRSHRIRA